MKSIKPGRGPSAMGGIAAAGAALFGIIWIAIAGSMGAYIMVPFGIIFVVIAIVSAAYNFYNAGAKNRLSNFDITDDGEEPDPLNQRFGNQRFCAQCGERLPENAKFCPGCGEKIVWNKEEAP